MRARKVVSLVEARSRLSRLTQEVAQGGGAVAITQRSRLAAVLVNAERFEQDMAELEHYRRQSRQRATRPLPTLMEITGDLVEGSRQLAQGYEAALKRSGDALRDALRD